MKRRIIYGTLAAFSVIGLALGIYLYQMYDSVKDTVAAIYEPLEPPALADDPRATASAAEEEQTDELIETVNGAEPGLIDPAAVRGSALTAGPVDLANKEPFTLLIMGVDERMGDHGRSDTIIVLAVNPAQNAVLMFNIPRDTRTELIGRGTQDKINHAYAFGGTRMAVDTVSDFLGVPINYYVKVNMEGLVQIIDILGGVKIDNPFTFRYEGVTYTEGPLSLNGRDAMMYTRMRYDDPRGDFGRNARQQLVLSDLIDRAKRISTVTKIPDILQEVEENTRTNLTLDDMTDIYTHYRHQARDIYKDEIKGSGKHIDGIYYYIVDQAERDRMRSKLAAHLQP
ncbi:LCP family protein [Paenibacillus sp. 1P07SE]|uniref:LCP family glycopolymer transferase n=1 Tax=Paenibacillus sp. 1P07SE TaxID=3132209 RepID=UPI0039A56F1F